MNGPGHRLLGAATALAVPALAHRAGVAQIDPGQALAAALAAVPFSAGRLSPDADQTWLSVLGHRRLVHGWWWPAALGLLLVRLGLGPAEAYVLWAPVLGWGSHLLGDAIFGAGSKRAGRNKARIPRGIPVLPFLPYRFGLGLRVTSKRDRRKGSAAERLATVGLSLATAALVGLTVTRLGAWPGA